MKFVYASDLFLTGQETEVRNISKACEKIGYEQCFDMFAKSRVQEEKYYSVLLFVMQPDIYNKKLNVFKTNLSMLIESNHEGAILLYSQLLGNGYIFQQDIDGSITFIKQYVNLENNPRALYLLSEIMLYKFKKNKSQKLLEEVVGYLQLSYSYDHIESGKLLALLYFNFYDETMHKEAVDIINKIRKQGDSGAEKMYNEYIINGSSK